VHLALPRESLPTACRLRSCRGARPTRACRAGGAHFRAAAGGEVARHACRAGFVGPRCDQAANHARPCRSPVDLPLAAPARALIRARRRSGAAATPVGGSRGAMTCRRAARSPSRPITRGVRSGTSCAQSPASPRVSILNDRLRARDARALEFAHGRLLPHREDREGPPGRRTGRRGVRVRSRGVVCAGLLAAGVDRAFATALMGWELTDDRFAASLELAARAGVDIRFAVRPLTEARSHPNTVDILAVMRAADVSARWL